MNNEAELIEQAKRGDADAFGRLVRHYQDRLFTTVTHMVGDRNHAEDIVQEAFVQAFLKLDGFRGNSSFFTWLYRIAYNSAVNQYRHRRAAVSVDATRELLGDELPDPSNHPHEILEREEQAAQIQQALQRLSEEFRAVLVLREMEGFDYETIANITNVSVGTVRSRLHRARALMREQLRRLAI